MRACVLEKEGLGVGDAFVCVCVFGKEWGNFLGSGLLAFYIDASFLVGLLLWGNFVGCSFLGGNCPRGQFYRWTTFPE